jgi:hypothetical protein
MLPVLSVNTTKLDSPLYVLPGVSSDELPVSFKKVVKF